MPKHFSKWLLIFVGVIVFFYIYKSAKSIFSLVSSPFTFGEKVLGSVTSGIGTLISDVEGLFTTPTPKNPTQDIQTGISGNLGITQDELKAAQVGYRPVYQYVPPGFYD